MRRRRIRSLNGLQGRIRWYEPDVLTDMWRAFLSELDYEGILDWDEVFVDASFFPAKKGERESGKPSGERDRSSWYWSMARVFLSEAIPTAPRRLRSLSLIRLLERSESQNEDPEGHGIRPLNPDLTFPSEFLDKNRRRNEPLPQVRVVFYKEDDGTVSGPGMA